MADVTLTYKGATIAELSDSGSKTIRTAGKYCEADIGLEYMKPSGGGGGYTLADVVSGAEPSGAIDISGLTCKKGALANCPNITRLTGTLAASNVVDLANGCNGLTVAHLHITSTGEVMTGFCFQYCTALQTCVFRIDGKNQGLSIFSTCPNLEKVDLTINRIRNNTFYNCAKLEELILRSNTITTLDGIPAFGGSAFASGKAGGTIRIPKALYDHLGDGSSLDYKAATNWSTVDGYGTITWAQIEGSIYETQYADGTPIPTT